MNASLVISAVLLVACVGYASAANGVLSCYSCQNCGTSKGTEATCNGAQNYCLKMTDLTSNSIYKFCVASCTETSDATTQVSCCTSDLCNAATQPATVNALTAVALLVTYAVASLVL